MGLISTLSLLCGCGGGGESQERVRKKILNKEAIYSVEVTTTTPRPPGESESMSGGRGGGVCVDPSGLVVTVAHILPDNHPEAAAPAVLLRNHSDPGTAFRAEIIQVWRQFDLCLLKICQEKQQPFGFVKLDHPLALDYGEPLFTFVNPPISLLRGYTSYPFIPEEQNPGLGLGLGLGFPATSDNRTINGDLAYATNMFQQARCTVQPYRTAATINGGDLLLDFHPHLPLVEARGMKACPRGSGFPVFESSGGRLVGVLAFPANGCDYIIPASFILSCVAPRLSSTKGQRKGKSKVVDGDGPRLKEVKVGRKTFLESLLDMVISHV